MIPESGKMSLHIRRILNSNESGARLTILKYQTQDVEHRLMESIRKMSCASAMPVKMEDRC